MPQSPAHRIDGTVQYEEIVYIESGSEQVVEMSTTLDSSTAEETVEVTEPQHVVKLSPENEQVRRDATRLSASKNKNKKKVHSRSIQLLVARFQNLL